MHLIVWYILSKYSKNNIYTENNQNSQRTWCADNRFLGSLTSIFLTKSFALSEILGQGSDEKSRSPFNTCSNIPCSDSVMISNNKESKSYIHHNQETGEAVSLSIVKEAKQNFYHPKKEGLHSAKCKWSLQHSKHLPQGHNIFSELQVQHSMDYQQHQQTCLLD